MQLGKQWYKCKYKSYIAVFFFDIMLFFWGKRLSKALYNRFRCVTDAFNWNSSCINLDMAPSNPKLFSTWERQLVISWIPPHICDKNVLGKAKSRLLVFNDYSVIIAKLPTIITSLFTKIYNERHKYQYKHKYKYINITMTITIHMYTWN